MLKNLFSLFRGIVGGPQVERKVIIVNPNFARTSRQYTFRPRLLRLVLIGMLLVFTMFVAVLAPLTPLRSIIPGYFTPEMQRNTRLIAVRMAQLEDSLAAQEFYLANLQLILTGKFDSSLSVPTQSVSTNDQNDRTDTSDPLTEPSNWKDHLYPALPVSVMPVNVAAPGFVRPVASRILADLQLPVLSPVDGFVTSSFDARTGHFGIDIATQSGSTVRCIGDGYVIFADWTYTGGHTIVVQHANGYMSVYKHNEQLLKQVSDRVSARESLAISGNSGEYTTGPHLHFELWNNGLAQDPSAYLLGL